MALQLPMVLSMSLYRDVNPVPTIPLADDLASAPSGPVCGRFAFTSLTNNFKLRNGSPNDCRKP